MTLKRKIILFISVLTSIGIIMYGYIAKQQSKTPNQISQQTTDSFSVCGWIPWWDYEVGLDEIITAPLVYTRLSPFIYDLTSDHKVELKIDQEIVEKIGLANTNATIIPTITNNFDSDSVSRIINSPKLSRRLVTELSVIANKYDGIEIDFEQLYPRDKDAYSLFIENLANKVHENGKILVVTLHPKTDDTGDWNGNKSQDWRALSQHADYLRIMAYDYHWSTSKPGPIAPNKWLEDVTNYAIKTIPLEKRILGIGLYGYDWEKGTEEAQSITLKEVELLDKIEGSETSFSRAYQAPYLEYEADDGTDHIVWYENTKSLENKINIAKEDYAGVCIWKIGGVTPDLYKTLHEAGNDDV